MKKLLLKQREICILAALLGSMFLVMIFGGCRSASAVSETARTDEQHSSTITRRTTVPDTIVYMLAPQYQECIVHDSTSVLSNDYATSRVSLLPDGTLMHSLDSRDRVVYVPVQTTEVRTDTIYSTSIHSAQTVASPTKRNFTGWGILILLVLALCCAIAIRIVK